MIPHQASQLITQVSLLYAKLHYLVRPAKLGPQTAWDAEISKLGAVVNYKLITARNSTQDGFSKTDAGHVLDALYGNKDHGEMPFARIRLVAKPPFDGKPHPDNGVYIHPDFGDYSYKDDRRTHKGNPHGWPVRVMTGSEFDEGLANPAKLGKNLSDRINQHFGQTTAGTIERKKARDAMIKSERVAMDQSVDTSVNAIRRASGEREQELTKRLVDGLAADRKKLAKVAKALAEKDPEVLFAQTARLLGISVEELKRIKKT